MGGGLLGGPRRRRRALGVVVGLVIVFPLAHAGIGWATRIPAPPVILPDTAAPGPYVRDDGGLVRVYLRGSPEAIGTEHARWLRNRMLSEEDELWSEFELHVPWWLARVTLMDYSRVRFRHLDRNVPDARRRELAAEALALQPDPFAERMPTYQRLLFLHAIYDIALPLEHSPLIGCTSFGFDGDATADGHAIVARAFDFEAGELLDKRKVVFLVREDGAIPFASVAWPGFVGVVTGMNAEGVVTAVHGARAGQPAADGVPVAYSLREVLERAHDTNEAIAILKSQSVMVSHIVFVADASGHFAEVERAPGEPAFVRDAKSHGTFAVTNHFEGPLAADPHNERVRRESSTVARRERIDALLADVAPKSVTPARALAMLRDHRCAGDDACSLGDRRAIDAFIATHGIVGDATARRLWVSVGPHLTGRFVELDLQQLLSDHDPASDPLPDALPEDPTAGPWRNGTPNGTLDRAGDAP